MQYIKTAIEGVLILEPKVHTDSRGFFLETFVQRDFEQHAGKVHFVQDNMSRSSRGVVRGLHFQLPPFTQAKLVSCLEGEVLDVAVDLRKDSPTFGQHVAVELSANNHRQLYLPRGMAHGFAVLSDHATFAYKCDNYYNPESEAGFNPFDSDLNIDWRIDQTDAILSGKDLARPTLNEISHLLPTSYE